LSLGDPITVKVSKLDALTLPLLIDSLEEEMEVDGEGAEAEDAEEEEVQIAGLTVTRKKKKELEQLLHTTHPMNSERTKSTISISVVPLKIPSFSELNDYAKLNLPYPVTKMHGQYSRELGLSDSSDDDYSGPSWKSVKKNFNATHGVPSSEWTLYQDIVSAPAFDSEPDLTSFWNHYSPKLPNLSKYARVLFCKPTSTAGVERLFSLFGRLCSGIRNQTSVKTMEVQQIYREDVLERLKDLKIDSGRRNYSKT